MATDPQDRKYEHQIIRLGNRGLNLVLPQELIPNDQYHRLDNVISRLEGVLEAAPGGVEIFSTATGDPIHSLRRFIRYADNVTWYIVGFGPRLEAATEPGGPFALLSATMSGEPLSMIPYKTQQIGQTYVFIGDTTQNIKVVQAAIPINQRMGILRPLAINGQPAVIATSAGAGVLTGSYDWRYTYLNQYTQAESNPSDVNNTQLSLTNEQANVPIVASSDTQVTHIRIYRRGGTLNDNWRFVTEVANVSGGVIDNATDSSIASARILELDNDVPVTTVNWLDGTTLTDFFAVPLPYLWGPVDETLFGTGDVNRPDTVYYSKKGRPESWPAANIIPIDAPQLKVVNGFAYDSKSFVFTRKGLYGLIPNLIEGVTWTPVLTPCGHGIVGPFAFCVGERIWFCAEDGVYETTGSEAVRVSEDIRPLFPHHASEGSDILGPSGEVLYRAISFGTGTGDVKTIRMAYHNKEVYLLYRDLSGNQQALVYATDTKAWRSMSANTATFAYSDETPQSNLILGLLDSSVVRIERGSLNGAPVIARAETGGHDQGFPRADKEYGDGAVWMNCDNGTVTVSIFLNSSNSPAHVSAFTGAGLRKYILPLQGLYGRHIAYRFDWQGDDGSSPKIHWIECAFLPHPEEIIERQTDWDDLGHPADKLVKGVLLTADTRGNPITLQVLYDGGTVGATFTIGPHTADRPRVYNVGWPSFRGRKVRILPAMPEDFEWKFYGVNKWLFDPEPESIGWHEVYWGDAGWPHDKIVKGITIEADTRGQVVTLVVLDDLDTELTTFTIGPGLTGRPTIYERSWAGRRVRNIRLIHDTSTGDWKLFRIVSWLFDPEPPDLIHLEAQETTHGFYGFHFERDSYLELRSEGQVTVTVIIDGVTQPAYLIASTASEHRRVYLPFAANKGKDFRYELDGAAAFHLYDMMIRAKAWAGEAYQSVRPSFTEYAQWPTTTVANVSRQAIEQR